MSALPLGLGDTWLGRASSAEVLFTPSCNYRARGLGAPGESPLLAEPR